MIITVFLISIRVILTVALYPHRTITIIIIKSLLRLQLKHRARARLCGLFSREHHYYYFLLFGLARGLRANGSRGTFSFHAMPI